MTVGELRRKLLAFEDDQVVLVQSPNEEDVWPVFEHLGEADEGEVVVIITQRH